MKERQTAGFISAEQSFDMGYLLTTNGGFLRSSGHIFSQSAQLGFGSATFSTTLNAGAIRFDPDPSHNRFFVGGPGTVDVYNATTLAVIQSITGFSGQIIGICCDEGNNRVFAFSSAHGYIIDGSTLGITLSVAFDGENFSNSCYDPVSNTVWVPSYYKNKLYVLAADTLTEKVRISDGPSGPGCLSLDPVAANNRVVLGNYGAHNIITYDRSTYLRTFTYPAPGAINDIFWDPDPQKNRMYAALNGGGLAVFDAGTFGLIANLSLGSGDLYASIDPVAANKRILAAYQNFGISVVPVPG
ncbi:hypothetical protein KXD93_22510 [Mucilaginibacter sp. BJC16-A38]|uniref:YncE family protein n=1 Tax=Mucilaginibacter phenanthrenivorans TaxID=1234842 RepID=UPI0021570F52|nr:hypothetical protein [Mucilaginibacter phenanthrenivorans]MCR8560444.1 hypothetical protein [Mucilaginibacter phenanthrenivorans]